jgi:hypothetical protein
VTEREHPLFGESCLDECFTEAEIEPLVKWLSDHRPLYQPTTVSAVEFPLRGNMSCSEMPIGGTLDFLSIDDAPDYDLPFKVCGLLDLLGGTIIGKDGVEREYDPVIFTGRDGAKYY